jgi:thioredoxin 2
LPRSLICIWHRISDYVSSFRVPELASRYNVRGIPNFIVFNQGNLVMQQAGVVDHNQMENWLRSANSRVA